MAVRKTKAPAVSRTKQWDMGNWKDMSQLFGLASAISKTVGEIEALCQVEVLAAVDVKSQDIAKARFKLVMKTRLGVKDVLPDEHRLARRLALDPNDHMSWHEAMEMIVRSFVMHENSYVVLSRRSPRDSDPDIIPVHYSRVTDNVSSETRKFVYRVTASTLGEQAIMGFTSKEFTSDGVMHIKGRMHTGERGLSTLSLGSQLLTLNAAMQTFQQGMAQNGLRPNAVITMPEKAAPLTDEQFNRLKREVDDMLKNALAGGKPALLEQGLKYEAIAMDALKSDLIKGRNLVRQQVASLFRVPAYKTGSGETEKYDNKAAAEQTYVNDSLIPITIRIESTFNRHLLTEEERLQGYSFQFDPDELYDRDREQASKRVGEEFSRGLITRGQANNFLGYDSVPEELDTYLIPVNSAVLKKDGTIEYVMPQKEEPKTAPEVPPADKTLRLVQ